MKKWLFTLLLLAVGLSGKSQHEAMYSQYMFNMNSINPAYSGSRDFLSTMALYRLQWVGFEGAPRTLTFVAHAPLKNPKNNFGISLLSDRIGVTQHNAAMLSYAYRLKLGKVRLAFGLQGGLSFIQDKLSQVITSNPDGTFSSDSPTFLIPRVGAGIYLDGSKFFLSLSAPEILEYKTSQYAAYIANSFSFKPYLLSAGYVFKVNPFIKFRPTVLLKYLKNSPIELDLNVHFIFKDLLWIGASYRTGDAIVGLLEIQATPQLKIGYAYDQTLTSLQKFNNGTHEFMIRYEFGYKLKAMSPRYF